MSVVSFFRKLFRPSSRFQWTEVSKDEAKAVAAARLLANDKEGRLFSIRRNVHRIEKGLTTRPRRVFGQQYVIETARSLMEAVDTGVASGEELAWFLGVLGEYAAAFPDEMQARDVGTIVEAVRSKRPEIQGDPERNVQIGVAGNNSIQELLASRVSIREFTEFAVPREDVDAALMLARTAPSSCNRQPTRFFIVRSEQGYPAICDYFPGMSTFKQGVRNFAVVIGDMSAFPDPIDRHTVYVDSAMTALLFLLGLKRQGYDACIVNWREIHDNDISIRKAISMRESERVMFGIAFGKAAPDAKCLISTRKSLDRLRVYS